MGDFHHSKRIRLPRSYSGWLSALSYSTRWSQRSVCPAFARSSPIGNDVLMMISQRQAISRSAPRQLWLHISRSIADARSNAEAVVRETREKLNAETSQSRGTLKAQLDAQLVEAEERIAAAKAGAMTNVRGIVINSTRAIAERLIGAAPAPGAIAHSVDHVLMRGADANDQR